MYHTISFERKGSGNSRVVGSKKEKRRLRPPTCALSTFSCLNPKRCTPYMIQGIDVDKTRRAISFHIAVCVSHIVPQNFKEHLACSAET